MKLNTTLKQEAGIEKCKSINNRILMLFLGIIWLKGKVQFSSFGKVVAQTSIPK